MPQSSTTPFCGIFVSYRRDDNSGHAGRLLDRLGEHFGDDQVFMDIDHIEPGEKFDRVIEDAVGSCEILIAVIGRHWINSTDDSSRRLDNPKDFVRLEIVAALKRDIRVIPVLVQGATMPKPQDLPDDMSELASRQALELSDSRWRRDVDRLISVMDKVLAQREVARHKAAEQQRQLQEAERRLEESRRLAEIARTTEEERQRKVAEQKARKEEDLQGRRSQQPTRSAAPRLNEEERGLTETDDAGLGRRSSPSAKRTQQWIYAAIAAAALIVLLAGFSVYQRINQGTSASSDDVPTNNLKVEPTPSEPIKVPEPSPTAATATPEASPSPKPTRTPRHNTGATKKDVAKKIDELLHRNQK